ncbi:MAG: cytochrome b [Motiliproteus sp.]
MAMTNSSTRFGWLTRLLHWLVAIHILGLVGLGYYMVGLSYYDPNYHDSLYLHKAFGVSALALGLIKALWYLANTHPGPTAALPEWQQRASSVVHGLLLLLMVAIPVSGYLISTSAGDGIELFGGIELAAMFTVSDEWRDIAIEVHEFTAYAILAITALHALAALKHQFIDRDGTLKRMLW